MLAEYYRATYQLSWCQQSTTETGINYVGVSRVPKSHVSVLLVLAEYYRVRYKLYFVSRVLQSQVSVLLLLAQYYRVRFQFCCCYQSTTESIIFVGVSTVQHLGISSFGVIRVLQIHVSVLLLLAEYYTDSRQFYLC